MSSVIYTVDISTEQNETKKFAHATDVTDADRHHNLSTITALNTSSIYMT
jgi:hypothetical protein